MPRPVCVKCKREMKSLEVGEVVLLNAGRMTMRTGYKVEQVPYQAYSGDSFECEGCGAREVRDSYTGDPYQDPYVSTIEGIEKGRSPFYKEAELRKISEQYIVGPAAEGYYLHRRGCPRTLFPGLATQEEAVRAMDWCVLNDGSVGVAIHWLSKGDVGPFLSLLDYFMEAANGLHQQEASTD